jgi:hypothetical protein
MSTDTASRCHSTFSSVGTGWTFPWGVSIACEVWDSHGGDHGALAYDTGKYLGTFQRIGKFIHSYSQNMEALRASDTPQRIALLDRTRVSLFPINWRHLEYPRSYEDNAETLCDWP